MKNVKLMAFVHPDFDKVLVKVESQTHINVRFGGNVIGDNRKFRASNGITLASNVFPAKDEADKNILWLKGNGTAKQNDTTVVLTKAQYAKVKVAVEEYNLYYSQAEIDKRDQAARAVVAARVAPCAAAPCVEVVG